MSRNNGYYSAIGTLIGFECNVCQEVKPSMWGDVCNSCRAVKQRHKESLGATRLKDAIALLEANGFTVTRKVPMESIQES